MFSVFPKKKKLVGENSKKSLIFKVEETFGKKLVIDFSKQLSMRHFFALFFREEIKFASYQV